MKCELTGCGTKGEFTATTPMSAFEQGGCAGCLILAEELNYQEDRQDDLRPVMKDHTHEVHGIMCGHVHTKERALSLIEHGPEGQWNFMCGEPDHDTQEAVDAAVVVCQGCAMTGYLLPLKVQQLPANHIAELNAQTESWNIREMTAEEVAEYYED